MTMVANTFATYETIGIREELSDVIYMISPEETPFMSNCGRGTAVNTHFEWQTDALASAVTNNYQLEGDDQTSFDAVTPTVRLGNYQQISRKTVIISDTEETVNKAGRKSELAYQLSKKAAELKRDMEAYCLQGGGASAGSDSAVRKTASMLAWVYGNTTFDTTESSGGTAGADPSYTTLASAARTDSTATAAFTEAMLKTALQLVWAAGGNTKTLMVDGPQKQTVSGFSGIATKTYYQNDKVTSAIIGAADVYVGDFGTIAIVPNRFQRHRDAWLLDWEYLQIAYLRKFRQVPLAKTGDAEKRLLVVEWGTKSLAPLAQGGCFDLT